MQIVKELIDEFLSKDVNVSDYRTAVNLLKRCGFLNLVRRLGLPSVIDNGSNLKAMAHEGSWSNGFQTGINNLEFFEKFYANRDKVNPVVSPTFGGTKIALREGYLSKDEVEKIEQGENK